MKRRYGEPLIVRVCWGIVLGAGIVGLLVYVFCGCHVHAHFHMGGGQSKEPPITIELPEQGDGD